MISADTLDDNLLIEVDVHEHSEEDIKLGKRNKKRKVKKTDVAAQVEIKHLDRDQFVKFVSASRKHTKLSSLEEADLKETEIRSTDVVEMDETDLSVPEKMRALYEKRHLVAAKNGQPRLLILCSSALRCLEVIRSLKNEFPSTAKLFAKHMKLDDQIDFLQRRPVDIGVGTPNRILKLSETFDLVMDECTLVIDMHRDTKNRCILDIPECRGDVHEIIRKYVRDNSKSIKLSWF